MLSRPLPFLLVLMSSLPSPLTCVYVCMCWGGMCHRSLERAVQAIRSSDGKPVTVELARDGDKTVKRTVQVRSGQGDIRPYKESRLGSCPETYTLQPSDIPGSILQECLCDNVKTGLVDFGHTSFLPH